MKRVIIHWTAGGKVVNRLDKKHYHFIVDQDGVVHTGNFPPEANEGPLKPGKYAAHTRGCNTQSIGISLTGMHNSTPAPFRPGNYPITAKQVESACEFIAKLCVDYNIKVTRKTVLSHAEVQPTLGIRQRGKWDIAWIPPMVSIGDPVEVGDVLRAKVKSYMPKPRWKWPWQR